MRRIQTTATASICGATLILSGGMPVAAQELGAPIEFGLGQFQGPNTLPDYSTYKWLMNSGAAGTIKFLPVDQDTSTIIWAMQHRDSTSVGQIGHVIQLPLTSQDISAAISAITDGGKIFDYKTGTMIPIFPIEPDLSATVSAVQQLRRESGVYWWTDTTTLPQMVNPVDTNAPFQVRVPKIPYVFDWDPLINGGLGPPAVPPPQASPPPSDPNKLEVEPGIAGPAINLSFQQSIFRSGPLPASIAGMQSDAYKAYIEHCQTAATAVLAIQPKQFETCTTNGTSTAQCSATIDNYINSCVSSLDPSVDQSALVAPETPPRPPEDELQAIRNVIGVLYQPPADGSPGLIFCTASRVSADWVVTARHCVNDVGHNLVRSLGQLQFVPFDTPTKPIQVEEISPRDLPAGWVAGGYDLSSDYVFLKAPSEPAAQPPAFPPMVAARPYEQLILASYLYPARMELWLTDRSISDDELVATGKWTTMMKFDASNNCTVAVYQWIAVCFLTGCQSDVASSGAPLFHFENSALELVGVHVGFVDKFSHKQCDDADYAATPNIAVVASQADQRLVGLGG